MRGQPTPLIALTRPDGGNARLAAHIRAACPDCRVVDWPLLLIESAADPARLRTELSAMAEDDWAVFVSPRAVRHAQALQPLAQWPARHWAAVGGATAAVLGDFRAGSATEILVPKTTQDSEGLLAAWPSGDLTGRTVWLVRGETGRETLAAGLRSRGARVRYLPVYRRRCAGAPPKDGADTGTLPAIWVITSPESLVCLTNWATAALDAGQRKGLLHSGLVVINERTEAKARALGFTGTIVRATDPDDQALARACSDRSLIEAG
ncbi:hypothetical protein A9404_09300 [Halothiobacillus diazotrophicus]|uniref:Uroporphyrinogen-III synthase n=1 Tax=Halothiobacillus diazotrophicus TaxID=1860122 RepID=A0A191ZI55_9GAMM|nr:uroporphyrinogen-III synthase [Halothiobacillus diazotrophicus]ANJ67559.1 hypothetical protein A9404_09300 [Halothiobacillus diazotrophicus]